MCLAVCRTLGTEAVANLEGAVQRANRRDHSYDQPGPTEKWGC